MKFEIVDFPWTHGYSESFVDQDRADQMGRDFPEWDDEVWIEQERLSILSMDIRKS